MPETGSTRHCIVTGSSSGIGLALTRRLLAGGWRVTGLDRQPPPAGDQAALRTLTLDLLDSAALEAMLPALVGDRPDAFVHCAGVMRAGRIAEAKDEDLDLLWRLHVGSAVAIMRQLASVLPDRTGRVVLVSSRGGLGRAGRGLYAATKSALNGLARSWALELAPRGVTVNVVAPGVTDTPMLRDPSRGEPPVTSLPIGRMIEPDEVAYAIACLLAPEAGAITGQTLYICGGSSLVAPS